MTRGAKLAAAASAVLLLAGIGYALGAVVARGPSGERVTINPALDEATVGGTTAAGGQYCGVERAAVKHLTDGFVPSGTPVVSSIGQLVAMAAPPVAASTARLPQERSLIELVGVHLIAAKQESDSDLHLIIATPTGAELNVEAPMAVCDSASPWAAELASARAAADAAVGPVSSTSYTAENLTVTVEGILFFDVLHGQRGAPNGVELHPLTYFAVGSSPVPPPIVTTTVAPTTTPETTTATTATATTPTTTATPTGRDDPLDELPGCTRYPDHIYRDGVKQTHCAASFFTTP